MRKTTRFFLILCFFIVIGGLLGCEAKKFTLTVVGDENGVVSGSGEYQENESVTISATADANYVFDGWYEEEALVSKENPYSFNMKASSFTIKATFIKVYSVTLTKSEGGTVSGAGSYKIGDTVIVTATPNTEYVFDGWYVGETLVSTENPYTFEMESEKVELKAKFNKITYELIVDITEGGTVSGAGFYSNGDTVSLTATPEEGYVFSGYFDNTELLSRNKIFSFTMTSVSKTIKAVFVKDVNYTVTLNSEIGGITYGEGTYKVTSCVDISVVTYDGYRFLGWYDEENNIVSTESDFSFYLFENKYLTARFEAKFDLRVFCFSTKAVSLDTVSVVCSEANPYVLENPTYSNLIEGAQFICWSTSREFQEGNVITQLTNSSIMEVYAIYGFEVTFVDLDGSEIKKIVPHFTLISDIPNDNPYLGLDFVEWYDSSLSFAYVTEELTLYAKYNLIDSMETSNTDLLVYQDDTTVKYTIVTPKEVDQITLTFFDFSSTIYSYIDKGIINSDDISLLAIFNGQINDSVILRTLTINEDNLSANLIDGPLEDSEQKIFAEEEAFTKYSASKETIDNQTIWTIHWNLGNTAVKYIDVKASISSLNCSTDGLLRLNIKYPSFDYDDGRAFEAVIYKFIEKNLTEPIMFNLNLNSLNEEQKTLLTSYNEDSSELFYDEEAMLLSVFRPKEDYTDDYFSIDDMTSSEFWSYCASRSPLYLGNGINRLKSYGMIMCNGYTGIHFNHMQEKNHRILVNSYIEGKTFAFYYGISDEARAVIAYQNGFEIDPEKFPIAYDILNKASLVLGTILTPEMTAFEKEKAIFDWMMAKFYEGIISNPEDDLSETRVKTAYGFLNGYSGDCMGWSGTFYTLCNMAGIPCIAVSSEAESGGPTDDYTPNHRFNMVILDGEFYFVETFWFYQKLDPSEGDYRFFNMTTETAAKNHKWASEDKFGMPYTESTTYEVDPLTGELIN